MLDDSRDLQQAVAYANRAAAPATVAVFGMGADGHTASLFPRMRGLPGALASPQDYVGVDASGCDGAQGWPQRISLTPAGIAHAATRLLLIRGEQKLALLHVAMSGDAIDELPVRALWSVPGSPLEVYWCP
jgi:6-phosphogluconolactonase